MNNQKKVQVTTSWDDGHKLDVKLGALLKKYDITGTLYVCPKDCEFSVGDLLQENEIKALSKDFEIGGHTINHPHLSQVPVDEAAKEIQESKIYFENMLGREQTAFCYPYGDYNEAVKEEVKKAGYKMARTVNRYAFSVQEDPFAMPTTFHTYQHYTDLHKIFSFANFSISKTIAYWDWETLAKALFDYTYENGGVYHLWGHSWEVEKYKGWEKLERVLAYIAHKNDVLYQTNTEVLS